MPESALERSQQKSQMDVDRHLALAERQLPVHTHALEVQDTVLVPFVLQVEFLFQVGGNQLGGSSRLFRAEAVLLGDQYFAPPCSLPMQRRIGNTPVQLFC